MNNVTDISHKTKFLDKVYLASYNEYETLYAKGISRYKEEGEGGGFHSI